MVPGKERLVMAAIVVGGLPGGEERRLGRLTNDDTSPTESSVRCSPPVQDRRCRYPKCGRDGIGVCVDCSEPVCPLHVSFHRVVRPYPKGAAA